jgi:hypothetical protein
MLTVEQAVVVKGFLLPGEKQHNIAAFFAANGGHIAEIAKGHQTSSLNSPRMLCLFSVRKDRRLG